MNFRGYIRDAREAAEAMIAQPNEIWRRGNALAKPEEELAAVIHYARKGFPADGKSLAIHAPHDYGPVYDELMAIAKEMDGANFLVETDGARYAYVGRPGHVKEAMRITNSRKPEMIADERQHREIGRLLGYDEDAIEEFVARNRRP